MPQAILPTIPQNITVHLGPPQSSAENVTVPFTDYIKNVASSEIYPTWPEEALRANIYAIITYALNRIYTEWYPSRGYSFDITNSTAFDQAFQPGRETFENIDRIVDEIFNDYVVRSGSVEPFFTQFCNGTTSTCEGLSQWGTVSLAEQGLSALEILRNFYGNDINIVFDAPVAEIDESYPGTPLVLGDSGNNVKIIQTQLNRIARNYPAMPKIAREDGVFGVDTQEAVRKFQDIFNLTENGTVDKSTWYRIKQYYVGVKSLSELVSEGITIQEAQVPYQTQLSEGVQGLAVQTIQYYLNVIAYFNSQIPSVTLNGIFGPETTQSVRAFQSFYGLPQTGIVDQRTWDTIRNIYSQSIRSLPEGYSGEFAKIYPGSVLSVGLQSDDVSDLQTYLSLISRYYTDIPPTTVTGYFGEQTLNAVTAFQRLFGIQPSGNVGPVTWNTIATQYDFLVSTEL